MQAAYAACVLFLFWKNMKDTGNGLDSHAVYAYNRDNLFVCIQRRGTRLKEVSLYEDP